MKNLIKEVIKEIKRKLNHNTYDGKNNITIHKNTARHIIKILKGLK